MVESRQSFFWRYPMLQTIEAFYEEVKPFVAMYNTWLKDMRAFSLPIAIVPDHICYKCSSSEEFEHMRQFFEKDRTYMYQSFISGRRVAIIKLPHNIGTHLNYIRYLELSDQKPDGSQVSGFDHIEIYPDVGTVESLVQELSKNNAHFQIRNRTHHTTYDTTLEGGLKIRIERECLIEKIKREEMR